MGKRVAAHADESFTDDSGEHVVVLITEDEPGYHRTTYTGTLDYCRSVADSINKATGLTGGDVLDIRASSMRASHI